MLKIYEYNGLTFQWEEGEQPEGAVEVKQAAPVTKEVKPTNKARRTRTKKAAE